MLICEDCDEMFDGGDGLELCPSCRDWGFVPDEIMPQAIDGDWRRIYEEARINPPQPEAKRLQEL
jgi:hypothetical protein